MTPHLSTRLMLLRKSQRPHKLKPHHARRPTNLGTSLPSSSHFAFPTSYSSLAGSLVTKAMQNSRLFFRGSPTSFLSRNKDRAASSRLPLHTRQQWDSRYNIPSQISSFIIMHCLPLLSRACTTIPSHCISLSTLIVVTPIYVIFPNIFFYMIPITASVKPANDRCHAALVEGLDRTSTNRYRQATASTVPEILRAYHAVPIQ